MGLSALAPSYVPVFLVSRDGLIGCPVKTIIQISGLTRGFMVIIFIIMRHCVRTASGERQTDIDTNTHRLTMRERDKRGDMEGEGRHTHHTDRYTETQHKYIERMKDTHI